MTLRRNPRGPAGRSRLRRALVALLCIAGAGLWVVQPTWPLHAASRVVTSTGARVQTVWLIVMENENWSSIKGSAAAPYLNNTLLPHASYATQYYNPPGIHPSLPNYLWLEAGTNFGVSNDDDPATNHQGTRQHLVSLLNRAGISWRAYAENVDGSRCPLTNNYPYAVRHDPFVYFDDVTDNRSATASYCITHIRPFSELAPDLRKNRTARYNFIIPNVCDDMHDTCSPLRNPIAQGDTWLKHTIPTIMSSQAYKQGGAIFITWDEGDGGDGPIGMIALSPLARGKGYHNSMHYTHSSTLRTIEEIFGVSPLLGDAARAADLGDLFVNGAIPRRADPPAPVGPGGSWKLAFDDEFDGTRLDTGKWQTLFPWGSCRIPGNQEQQCYAPSALSEANGILSITATRQERQGYPYTSGMISSYASYTATHGYFEMRAQVPKGAGLWPTFWLIPHDQSWPPEIDVMELRDSDPTTVYLTNHFGTADQPRVTRVARHVSDLSAGFHTYGVDWEPHAITWYIDGVRLFQTTTEIPDKPMYIIVNLAVGGDWPGAPDAATPFPSALKLDYIRAFVPA